MSLMNEKWPLFFVGKIMDFCGPRSFARAMVVSKSFGMFGPPN